MFFFVFFWILDNGIIGKRVKQVRHLYSGVELRIGHICLNICGDIDMSFCTLTLSYFCVSSLLGYVQTSLTRILWFIDHYPIILEIELFTALNSFGVQ